MNRFGEKILVYPVQFFRLMIDNHFVRLLELVFDLVIPRNSTEWIKDEKLNSLRRLFDVIDEFLRLIFVNFHKIDFLFSKKLKTTNKSDNSTFNFYFFFVFQLT